MSYSIFGTLYRSNAASGRGPKGEKGTGFDLTGQGDFDIGDKRLTNVTPAIDRMDAVNKDFADSTYLPLYGSKPMKHGLSMQGARIEGLPEVPYVEWDVTSKVFVKREDANVKAYAEHEDAKVKAYVDDQGAAPTSINYFDYLEEGDYTVNEGIAVFIVQQANRYFKKYHNEKHALFSLASSGPANITVDLGGT